MNNVLSFNRTVERTAWEMLRQMGLAFEYERSPRVAVDLPAFSRDSEYYEVWRRVLTDGLYSYLLSDLSAIQIGSADVAGFECFAFYPVPHSCVLYSQYLDGLKRNYGDRNPRDLFKDYVQTTELNDRVLPIRYEVDQKCFKPGKHPYAHLHVGHNTRLLLTVDRKWSLLSFMCFVTRHFYSERWQDLYIRRSGSAVFKHVRDDLDQIDRQFMQGLCAYEVLLA